MARPQNKADLIDGANRTFEQLWQTIDTLNENELTTEFNFSENLKLKEAHWVRDKNIKDILIHLYEWHQLLIHWIVNNQAGNSIPFLPEPYNWKNYQEMNVQFWETHQNTPYQMASNILKESHSEVIKIIEQFTNEELFTKKYFSWTGTTSVGSYCVSSTSSHYEWAIKKLKKHKNNVSHARCTDS